MGTNSLVKLFHHNLIMLYSDVIGSKESGNFFSTSHKHIVQFVHIDFSTFPYVSVVWMNQSLRNAFCILKNSWRTIRFERPWRNFFHSGKRVIGYLHISILYFECGLEYTSFTFVQWWAGPDYDGNSQWKPFCKVLQQSAEVLHQTFPAQ